MTPVVGLDHVQVAAPQGCEREARRFYGELLGLPEIDKPHIGVQEPFFPARKAHPALRVRATQLDALALRLAEAGAEVIWDEELPDVRRFFSEDPWGNRIELMADSSAA
jgi:catechol 2,3-dioxygenase-like lactoylglutathione lyase family enzyme